MRGFHGFLRQNQPLCHTAVMEINLNGLHNNSIHVSGLTGEDGSTVKLKAVS
jgi:hypothetical protein